MDDQPSDQGVWFEDTSDPWFRPLSPPDDGDLGELTPSVDFPPGGRLGTDSAGEGGRSPLKARLWWIPQQNLQNQPGDLAMNGEEVEVAFPLRIAPDGIWLGLGSVQRLEISTSAVLPDSGLPVPSQLWGIEVGAMHLRTLDNGWRAGGMLRVGSPSDRPFAALRDMTVTILGFLTIPSGERDAWNFSLFYSPTAQIIFPIPGVACVRLGSPDLSSRKVLRQPPRRTRHRPRPSGPTPARVDPLKPAAKPQ